MPRCLLAVVVGLTLLLAVVVGLTLLLAVVVELAALPPEKRVCPAL